MRESVELALERSVPAGRPARGLPPDAGRQPGAHAGDRPPVLDGGPISPESIVVPLAGRPTRPPDRPALGPRHARSRRSPATWASTPWCAHPERVVEVEIPQPELAENLNTPEDLERWQQREHSLVKVRLFAVARERAGQAEIEVELPLPATVADLRLALALQHPGSARWPPA